MLRTRQELKAADPTGSPVPDPLTWRQHYPVFFNTGFPVALHCNGLGRTIGADRTALRTCRVAHIEIEDLSTVCKVKAGDRINMLCVKIIS